MSPMLKRYSPQILALGDVLALAAFAFLGQLDHSTVNPENPVLGLLPLLAEFAVPWLAIGWWLGAFPTGGKLQPGPFFNVTLNTWLAAAPLGLLARAIVLRRTAIPVTFILVTLGLGAAFVFGWRLIFFLLMKNKR